MSLEPVAVLFGAVVALVVREAVEALKSRRRRRARDTATVAALNQELAGIRAATERNAVVLRSAAKKDPFRSTGWGRFADPLHQVPSRMDELLRLEGAQEFVRNGQVARLLGRVGSTTTYINRLEEERLRLIASKGSGRVAEVLTRDDIPGTIELRQDELFRQCAKLLSLTLTAEAVVRVVAVDQHVRRSLRGRFGGRFYHVPHDCERVVLQALVDTYADEDPDAGTDLDDAQVLLNYAGGLSYDEFTAGLQMLQHHGLIREVRPGWALTARGRVVAGVGVDAALWPLPTAWDMPEERVDWAAFWALDA